MPINQEDLCVSYLFCFLFLFNSLITRMRCKIVGGCVTFRFLNGEAILDENMLFWVRLYALEVVLKILLDFRL